MDLPRGQSPFSLGPPASNGAVNLYRSTWRVLLIIRNYYNTLTPLNIYRIPIKLFDNRVVRSCHDLCGLYHPDTHRTDNHTGRVKQVLRSITSTNQSLVLICSNIRITSRSPVDGVWRDSSTRTSRILRISAERRATHCYIFIAVL